MITEEKIKAIRKAVSNGKPEGEIKQELLAEGYSNEDIAKAFAPADMDMRGWYLSFAVLFLLLGLYKMIVLLLIFSALLFMVYANEQRKRMK